MILNISAKFWQNIRGRPGEWLVITAQVGLASGTDVSKAVNLKLLGRIFAPRGVATKLRGAFGCAYS